MECSYAALSQKVLLLRDQSKGANGEGEARVKGSPRYVGEISGRAEVTCPCVQADRTGQIDHSIQKVRYLYTSVGSRIISHAKTYLNLLTSPSALSPLIYSNCIISKKVKHNPRPEL